MACLSATVPLFLRYNVRRVERFMVQVLEENIKPVLVLNKSDLDFDRQSVEEQIKRSTLRTLKLSSRLCTINPI